MNAVKGKENNQGNESQILKKRMRKTEFGQRKDKFAQIPKGCHPEQEQDLFFIIPDCRAWNNVLKL